MASHVALSALMAVFPFLIFVAALAGFIGEADLADRVAALLFDTWPKEVAEPIANDVQNVLPQPHSGLLTVSVAITIYLASNGVEAVRTALNRAYRVSESRSFFFLPAAEPPLRRARGGGEPGVRLPRRARPDDLRLDRPQVPEIPPFQTDVRGRPLHRHRRDAGAVWSPPTSGCLPAAAGD